MLCSKGVVNKELNIVHPVYRFDEKGRLVKKKDGSKFSFTNQEEYDNLGEFVVSYIQAVMETKYNFTKIIIPLDKERPYQKESYVFISENPEKYHTVVYVIQGSGAVRPGQWSRALCINESLDEGSIFPYLQDFEKRGWGCVVFNPNDAIDFVGGRFSTYNSVNYVHRQVVIPRFTSMRNLLIVAHSAGGVRTVDLMRSDSATLARSICAVAFTDSVHGLAYGHSARDDPASLCLYSNAIHFKCSSLPLSKYIGARDGCSCVSAGTVKHEWSSCCAKEAVIEFFERRVREREEEREGEEGEEREEGEGEEEREKKKAEKRERWVAQLDPTQPMTLEEMEFRREYEKKKEEEGKSSKQKEGEEEGEEEEEKEIEEKEKEEKEKEEKEKEKEKVNGEKDYLRVLAEWERKNGRRGGKERKRVVNEEEREKEKEGDDEEADDEEEERLQKRRQFLKSKMLEAISRMNQASDEQSSSSSSSTSSSDSSSSSSDKETTSSGPSSVPPSLLEELSQLHISSEDYELLPPIVGEIVMVMPEKKDDLLKLYKIFNEMQEKKKSE